MVFVFMVYDPSFVSVPHGAEDVVQLRLGGCLVRGGRFISLLLGCRLRLVVGLVVLRGCEVRARLGSGLLLLGDRLVIVIAGGVDLHDLGGLLGVQTRVGELAERRSRRRLSALGRRATAAWLLL